LLCISETGTTTAGKMEQLEYGANAHSIVPDHVAGALHKDEYSGENIFWFYSHIGILIVVKAAGHTFVT